MKKTLIFGITILATSIISIVLFSYLTGNPTYPKSVVQTTIHSKILNEEREMIIHLPINYDEKKSYSVSKIRSMAGNSRGGLLLIYSLVYKPDLFKGRFCFSPAFWREDNLIVKKVSDFLATNENLNSFLYLSMGEDENDKMKNGFNEMIKTLSKEQNGQLVWYSEFSTNADHQNNAEISASVGIRKWTDYLKPAE